MLAFKVVEKNTRCGTNWAIYKNNYNTDFSFIKKHKEYFPRYLKNTIVHAVKGSVGILCFKDEKHAQKFIDIYQINAKIVKVEGYNQNLSDFRINCHCGSSPHNILGWERIQPPKGTIAFESVKVLE